MKEFDENMAAELMLAALSPERRSLFSTDNAIEVIDLILSDIYVNFTIAMFISHKIYENKHYNDM